MDRTGGSTRLRPFEIAVPDGVLDDLRGRIVRTRFPERTPGPRWSAGTDPGYLEELLRYWAGEFDWRARERRLNSRPQFLADVGGVSVHFAHVAAVRAPGGPPALPLLVTHGWPYSFVEMLPLAERLADPGSHGADPGDAFDVVVPSLPGYGYSGLPAGLVTPETVADLWARLMTERLGYERFGTYGEDIGAGVSDWLAATRPDSVVGIHASHAAYPPADRRDHLSTAESAFLDWLEDHWRGGTAYSMVQSTRPDTLAAGLSDSPAGLAAWLVEKFRSWSDCGGDIERRFRKDDLLTTITLYWVTNTIGTSFRSYHDASGLSSPPQISVPAGITVSRADLGMPRELAERTYRDIRYWNRLPRGAHFTAWEEPELVAADIRRFFRSVRSGSGS